MFSCVCAIYVYGKHSYKRDLIALVYILCALIHLIDENGRAYQKYLSSYMYFVRKKYMRYKNNLYYIQQQRRQRHYSLQRLVKVTPPRHTARRKCCINGGARSRLQCLTRPIKQTTGIYFSINLFYYPPTTTRWCRRPARIIFSPLYIYSKYSRARLYPCAQTKYKHNKGTMSQSVRANGYIEIKITGKSPITIKYFICIFSMIVCKHPAAAGLKNNHKIICVYTRGITEFAKIKQKLR